MARTLSSFERNQIKEAKRDHKKSLRNIAEYKANREPILQAIVNSRPPKWGSIKVSLMY